MTEAILTSTSNHPTGRVEAHARQALLVGVLDSLAPAGYLLFGEAVVVQALALTLKLLLFVGIGSWRVDKSATWVAAVLFALAVTAAMADAAAGAGPATAALLRFAAFTASLVLSITLVGRHAVAYLRGVVVVATGAALLHIALVGLGSITSHFGRFFYLGDGHPNLGGEIAAVAAMAAGLTLRSSSRHVVLGILTYDCMLMQSRAALLVVVLVWLVCLVGDFGRKVGPSWRLAIGLGATVAGALVVSSFTAELAQLVDRALLLADPTRGVATGLAGRDERWLSGWALFENSPLMGNGLSLFNDEGLSPHSAILQSLAQHGLLSLAWWGVLASCWMRLLRADPRSALIVAAPVLLLVLNDRFINLNTYPFVYYATILIAGSRPASLRPTAARSSLVPSAVGVPDVPR